MDSTRDIQLHIAGATVRQESPFAALEVPVSESPLDREVIEKWVLPFYQMQLGELKPADTEALRQIWDKIDSPITSRLLAQFNWRPRIVGAYFVALKKMAGFEDQIGRLLLRSDLCYAGKGYCLALAVLNTPGGSSSLHKYLDYYLGRKDLWFDQGDAMAAVSYLDSVNGTAHLSSFLSPWQAFIADKPEWSLARSTKRFLAAITALQQIQGQMQAE